MGPDYFRDNLADVLHLRSSSSLLVGNLKDQRTAWLVISVLNGIREEPGLFDADFGAGPAAAPGRKSLPDAKT
jgi:hypothetical protein